MGNEQERAKARFVTVTAESAERRLDNFLLSELKGLPRSRIYRMIRGGEVRVNKGRSKASYRLKAGDMVRVPPVHGLTDGKMSMPQAKAAWINDCVLREDERVLVLNKPSGLAVHGGSGISAGAIELLRAARPDAPYLELAHRLDRDTSGCLLVAKKRSALRRLHEGFRTRTMQKTYLTLLDGAWWGGDEEVTLPLKVEHRQNGERHVIVDEEGKAAITQFHPETIYEHASFMRVNLLTGRTHQIRVHAAALGHPIAGDKRYGNINSWVVEHAGLKRLFLHAAALEYPDPAGGDETYTVEAPLDATLVDVLNRLESEP